MADGRLEGQFAQNENGQSGGENEEGTLGEEVQFINDCINEIDISNIDIPQRKQSQITNFSKNNVK